MQYYIKVLLKNIVYTDVLLSLTVFVWKLFRVVANSCVCYLLQNLQQ